MTAATWKPTLAEAVAQMGQDYRWKEDFMTQVQAGVRSRVQEVTDQTTFNNVVQSEVNRVREQLLPAVPAPELDFVSKMVQNTLSGIPWNIFTRTV